MDIAQLSTQLTAALAPFLPKLLEAGGKVVEGMEAKIGEEVWDKINSLWSKLKPKVEENPFAKRAVQQVAAAPNDEDVKATMRAELKNLLKEDAAFAKEITQMWVENKNVITNAIASGNNSAAFAAEVTKSFVNTGSNPIINITHNHPAAPSVATHQNPAPGLPEAKQATSAKKFLHNLPFSPNSLFTDPHKLLDQLNAALCKKSAAAITQPQAVHGLGGVGKTQLAVEYAWRHHVDHDAVLWAGVASPAEMHANLAKLADVLELSEAAATKQEDKVQAVLKWLQTHEHWLLILDNADTKETQAAVQDILPGGLRGHVIVTSRLENWPVNFGDIKVTKLPKEDARDFLIKRAEKSGFKAGDPQDALKIAVELDGLPLALEQAGAYIARHHITFAAYLELLKASRAKVLAEGSAGGTKYPKSVAETWLVSEAQLSSTAKAILQIAAFLAPDEIPRDLFMENGKPLAVAATVLVERDSADNVEPLIKTKIGDALAELAEHSLVELETDVLSCHRLLQAILLDRLGLDAHTAWGKVSVRMMNHYAPENPLDFSTRPMWNKLRSHAGTLLNIIGKDADAETSALMNQLGLYLYTEANYTEAEPLLRKALANDENNHGPEHPEVATRLNNLAQLLYETDRLKEAEPLYKRALVIEEKCFGSEHTKVAIVLNNLAQLYNASNKPAEAEPLMRRGLAIEEANRGANHHFVAIQLSNLALLLQATNRLAEAEPLMRRALAIDEKSFGLEHPSVSICLNNLAGLLHATNRQVEAEQLYRRALAIDEKSYGPEHPKTAIRLNNLGLLLKDTNRLAEAEPLMRRALAIDEKCYGSEHTKVATDLSNLGQLLHKTNRLTEAESMLRRALSIDEKNWGPNHPDVAIRLNNLATLLKTTNRLAEAEHLYCRALTIFERSLGEHHTNVAIAINNLAHLFCDNNRLMEAEPLAQRATRICISSLGLEHPNTQIAINNYKGILSAMKLSEAELEAKLRAITGQ